MIELRWLVKNNGQEKILQYRKSIKIKEFSGIDPYPETVEIDKMGEWKDVPLVIETEDMIRY
jgi:hypothetical protein